MFADASTASEKIGWGTAFGAVCILLGKYWTSRPKLIESQSNADDKRAATIAAANAALIDQINSNHAMQIKMVGEINLQHTATLNEAIAYHKDRADRTEVMLKASVKTKHKMSQELNRQGLVIQFWDCILTEHKIEHEAVALIDMEAMFEEEDETSRQMTLRPLVVTSQHQLTDQPQLA